MSKKQCLLGVSVRGGDPARHRAHVPGARLLPRGGRAGAGLAAAHGARLRRLRPRGRLLPGAQLPRRHAAAARQYTTLCLYTNITNTLLYRISETTVFLLLIILFL